MTSGFRLDYRKGQALLERSPSQVQQFDRPLTGAARDVLEHRGELTAN